MLSSPALPHDGQITLVVGFAAGGTSSTAARIFAESVEQITRSSTVVENRPGAGGAIAADWVLRQKGTQTLLFMSSTSSLKTSPQSGLVPIGVLATFSYVAVTKRDSPGSLAVYMNGASREEKYRTVATAGAGSIPHLIGAKLFSDYGVPMVHVPYQGSAPAILSVAGGHVAVAIVPFPDFIPFQDSLRILAQTGSGLRRKDGAASSLRRNARCMREITHSGSQYLSYSAFNPDTTVKAAGHKGTTGFKPSRPEQRRFCERPERPRPIRSYRHSSQPGLRA
jgi:tripartite-type tricarboxylate transporter receptor subunit TctC